MATLRLGAVWRTVTGETVAVYTKINDAELKSFLIPYKFGELLSFVGIVEGVENSNYLLLTQRGRYILTIYEKRVQRSDLPFFLRLMKHLSSHGIACPVPVTGDDGKMLREVAGKPASVLTFLAGSGGRQPGPAQCRSLGRALAELHVAGQDFGDQRPNDLSVTSWPMLLNRVQARADEIKVGLARDLESEIEDLVAHWPASLPRGIIHADLFPDNALFKGNLVSGLIDFYFACTDLFAYDLAICLNSWCFEPDGAFNATKARLMLSAYRKGRPFSCAELDALPLLCRAAALRFLLTRLYDWLNSPERALVSPKDPLEYFHKLSFHRQVRGPGEYGLE